MLLPDSTYTFYSCTVDYQGEEVSFVLYEQDHQAFADCGGVGDQVKISVTKEPRFNKKTGAESLVEVLHFERV